MYSELRAEAHDHARLRNAYFEQVMYLKSCPLCVHFSWIISLTLGLFYIPVFPLALYFGTRL